MVERQDGHGHVEGAGGKGKGLGARLYDRGPARALADHGEGGLDRDDVAALGLVGTGARAHVDHASRIAERVCDRFGEAHVGHALMGIPPSDALVIHGR